MSCVEQVKVQRESLVRARTKIAQVTADLREKEVIIGAIKQESTVERESLLEKVSLFTECHECNTFICTKCHSG